MEMRRAEVRNFDVNELSLSYNCIPKGLWQLSQSAITLYLIILDFQTPKLKDGELIFDGVCALTNKEIKAYTGIGDRMISTGINDLVEAGILTCRSYDGHRTLEINHTPFRDMQHEMEAKAAPWGWNHPVLRPALRSQYETTSLSDVEFVSKLTDEQVNTACKNIHYRSEHIPRALEEERDRRRDSRSIGEAQEGRMRQSITQDGTQIEDSARVHLNKTHIETNNLPTGETQQEVGGCPSSSTVPEDQKALSEYSKEGADQTDLLSIPSNFGSRASELPATKAEAKRLKGAERFALDPEHATCSNMIEYFQKVYKEVHGYPTKSVVDAQTVAIIRRSFFEAYPRPMLKDIVDHFIKDYAELPIDHEKYPTATLRGLTQKWLIEYVLDRIRGVAKVKERTEELKVETESVDNFKRFKESIPVELDHMLDDLDLEELDKLDELIRSGKVFEMDWLKNTRWRGTSFDQLMKDIRSELLDA